MKLVKAYRGDGRDDAAMKRSGGFVPKYLLETHAGGLEGFIACPNKVDGKLGCNCANQNEDSLYSRARQKLTDMLTNNPMSFQQHVMFNNVGLLSTAVAQDDAYGGHQYKIFVEMEFECTVGTAEQALGLVIRRRNALSNPFRIFMNAKRIANATLIGVIPHQAVEISFISPVAYRYLTYDGFV